MDILIMILCTTIVLGFLVFIHEGGHFLAARAFGVRVTEFMIGFPGPGIGFKKGETKFGITIVPLGGYAKVCGMEPGEMSPHLEAVLAALYRRGTATMEDIASDCGITDDEAYEALEELTEWGSCTGPTKKDEYNTYRTPAFTPSRRLVRKAERANLPVPATYIAGKPRPVENAHALFESEYHQQFIFSVIGFDIQLQDTGEIIHRTLTPIQAVQFGFMYIGMVFQAVLNLFNPATVAQTMSDSTSVLGIAILSKSYFEAGFTTALEFMAMISVSLGIMNLLPIPPLDGGRFVVEVFQKFTKKLVSSKAMNYLSVAGMVFFLGFFVIMLNQDIQRTISGYWG